MAEWISPTGHNDPDEQWADETYAYDEDTGTFAYPLEVDYWLLLTHSGIDCDKVRIWWHSGGSYTLDVYYSGSWHNLVVDVSGADDWQEYAIGSTQRITAARVKTANPGYRRLFEFDFWGVLSPPDAPTVTTQAVSNIGTTTATGNGNITDDGGESCSKRGVCWNTTGNPTVADSKSEETDSFGIGAFTRPMTGLSPGQHYYVKAYAYNSAGYGYGGQVEFTTFGEVTYYYTSYGGSGWTDPLKMVDGILANFASTSSDGTYASLTDTTCPGTGLGTITKVELRAYGHGDGDDRIDFSFYSVTRDPEYQAIMPSSEGWSSWLDVTNDPNIGPWTWAKVAHHPPASRNFAEFDKVGKGNTMYCSKVEIRVTFTPITPPPEKVTQYLAGLDLPEFPHEMDLLSDKLPCPPPY